jgi:acyl-coenzyme A thioesterase PaaI-like protein
MLNCPTCAKLNINPKRLNMNIITGKDEDVLIEMRDRAHPNCFVCNLANPKGLHAKYILSDDGEDVKALFWCDKKYEGFPGAVHGGVISSILDGAMCNCLFARSKTAVTVEMTTRFRHPVKVCRIAAVSARITQHAHSLYFLEANIIQDGQLKVFSKGKFYEQPQLADTVK